MLHLLAIVIIRAPLAEVKIHIQYISMKLVNEPVKSV